MEVDPRLEVAEAEGWLRDIQGTSVPFRAVAVACQAEDPCWPEEGTREGTRRSHSRFDLLAEAVLHTAAMELGPHQEHHHILLQHYPYCTRHSDLRFGHGGRRDLPDHHGHQLPMEEQSPDLVRGSDHHEAGRLVAAKVRRHR